MEKEKKTVSAVAIEKLSFNKSFASDWEKYRETTQQQKIEKQHISTWVLWGRGEMTFVWRATLRKK